MYHRMLLVLLLIVGLVAVPVRPVVAEDGGGWIDILTPVKNAVWVLFGWIQDWFRGMICRFRVGLFNAIAKYFCMECRAITVEPGEIPDGDPPGGGGGGLPACYDLPDCQCALCPTWLSEHKQTISTAIAWFVGAGNVLGMFIPWSFWATLYVAYIQAAAAIWFIRLVAKVGLLMFGAVT